MEPTTGIEPVTSSLPRKCSTTEPCGPLHITLFALDIVCVSRGSQSSCIMNTFRLLHFRVALPKIQLLWLYDFFVLFSHSGFKVICPVCSSCISGAGDGNRTHIASLEGWNSNRWTTPACIIFKINWWRGKDSNLRRLSRQIYSLIPLTAREPLQKERYFLTCEC